MRKLKLYLETSAWNFYFADDAPEKRDLTKEFFDLVNKGVYEIYISDVVLAEIDRAPKETAKQLRDLINKYQPIELNRTPEVENLADVYLERKIVPEKKVEDAMHIAIATINELDALITWNYRHMANLRKVELFFGINLEEGYTKRLEILTPMGVIRDE